MVDRQQQSTTEQRLREVLRDLDVEGRELAAIYVAMALERLDHRFVRESPGA